MTESPTTYPSANPDADPAAPPQPDLLSLTGALPSRQPWSDPVEEEGARFARAADEGGGVHHPAPDAQQARVDLSPAFLAPVPPA